MASDGNTSHRLLDAKDLVAKGVARSEGAIYSARYRGDDLPPAIRIGANKLRWREEDVDAWIASKTDNSDDGPRAA